MLLESEEGEHTKDAAEDDVSDELVAATLCFFARPSLLALILGSWLRGNPEDHFCASPKKPNTFTVVDDPWTLSLVPSSLRCRRHPSSVHFLKSNASPRFIPSRNWTRASVS